MRMDFSLIIVNYNLTNEVIECINSVIRLPIKQKYEIIVIDNGSKDAERLLEYFPQNKYEYISIFLLKENKGFGAANNYGVKKAKGKILFLLNPDTILIEDIFTDVLDFFSKVKNIGIIGTKIININNRQELSYGIFPNLFTEFLDIFFLKRFYLIFLTKSRKRCNKKIHSVDWVTGASMFIPTNIYNEIGGFDEDFFLYNEDIDLCKRIKNKGYTVLYNQDIKIKHIGSASSKKNYYLFTLYSYDSRLLYYKKHFHSNKIIILKFFLLIHIFLQIILWSILFFVKRDKSVNKIKAFHKLIKKIIFN